MSEGVVTCDFGADIGEVARLMQEYRVRRIPVMEDGRLAGLVTVDDLMLDGSVDVDALRGIVTARLEVEAPGNPRGVVVQKDQHGLSSVPLGEPARSCEPNSEPRMFTTGWSRRWRVAPSLIMSAPSGRC